MNFKFDGNSSSFRSCVINSLNAKNVTGNLDGSTVTPIFIGLNANDGRITNVGDPVEIFDAINLGFFQENMEFMNEFFQENIESINRVIKVINLSGRLNTSQLLNLGEYKVIDDNNPLLIDYTGTGSAVHSITESHVNLSVTAGQFIISSSKLKHPYFSFEFFCYVSY